MQTFYIVDGHALCYRAYYAFIRNPLINSSGQNTSAIFGFARMLLELIKTRNPDNIVVAFDPPGKTFRFEMFSEYKANRQKMPDDLREQIDEIKQLVSKLGIPSITVEGYEADDVLGTLSNKLAPSFEVFLVTGDKDAYQLVNENVKIYANTKGVSEFAIFDEAAVEEKLGVKPTQVIDYMAIVGDTADNVPGIKGVGPKSAQKLISGYGSLDEIYNNIEELKGKQKTLFEEHRENAYLSKELVTIQKEVPFEFEVENAKFEGFQSDKCSAYFTKLEMPSLAAEFSTDGKEAAQEQKHQYSEEAVEYTLVLSKAQLEEAAASIAKQELIAVDTETTSVRPVEADMVGVSISIREKQGYYFPVLSGGLFNDTGAEYSKEELISTLKPILENSAIKKVGQNIKYDSIIFSNEGISLSGIYFDTMVASYVLNPSRRHNMDDLALEFLNYTTIHFEDIVGKGKSARLITDVPLEELCIYACEDTDITLRLYNKLKPALEKEGQLNKLFFEIEMPLVHVLTKMEEEGVILDTSHYSKLSQKVTVDLGNVETNIYELAETNFNINSTKELSGILFEKLGMKPVKKTKTGYSTDISVLEALKNEHAIIPELITYRTLSKLKNTYIDTLPKLVFEKTGRIHTSYNQTVAATGRLSSTDPNLQNIPVKDEFGKHLRGGFIAREGFHIVSADYSQIELRLAAHISGDSEMKQAFNNDVDIHRLTASNVYGVAVDEVTDSMRRQAKIVNFSTIYGVSPFGLSRQSDISISEAKVFIDKYFETYPGFREYIDRTVAFCKETGYVETLCGRRRYLPEINSKTSFRREGAERIAINTPIQGSSADMIKIAMINIQRYIEEQQLSSRLLMQVHDELVFEIADDEKSCIETIITMMETALPLDVPIKVDFGEGKSWEDAH